MLERYFVRPTTVDQIRACWIGQAIERYVTSLSEQGYAARCVHTRVPILLQFGEFARKHGATAPEELPAHIESFIGSWLGHHGKTRRKGQEKKVFERAIRNPINQFLRLILPGYSKDGRCKDLPIPFTGEAPGFFPYLRTERGLREPTIAQYEHHLRRLETYLRKIKLHTLSELSPAVLSAFITETGQVLDKRTVQGLCSKLKVFLRYLFHARTVTRDFSTLIESPRRYRLSNIPRSISWDEVRRMLEAVDQRTPAGRRDYAILLLLVTYGLRAREVAALTLDDVDWKRDRLNVPERKAGHSTAYPLSPVVGKAIVAYLNDGRPQTQARTLFIRTMAPHTPVTWVAVSLRAKYYLRKAGIEVARPGSHTLRHTCVQRLVDAQVSFKTIGDFVGHRTPDATAVYTKVDIEPLREVAMGDGEAIL